MRLEDIKRGQAVIHATEGRATVVRVERSGYVTILRHEGLWAGWQYLCDPVLLEVPS